MINLIIDLKTIQAKSSYCTQIGEQTLEFCLKLQQIKLSKIIESLITYCTFIRIDK